MLMTYSCYLSLSSLIFCMRFDLCLGSSSFHPESFVGMLIDFESAVGQFWEDMEVGQTVNSQ